MKSVILGEQSERRPDLKGIKTIDDEHYFVCFESERRPDLKGIKTSASDSDPSLRLVRA